MKLLLAVDGSDCSTRAVRQVVKLSRALRKKATLIVLHVDPPILQSVAVRIGAERTQQLHAENSEAALKTARGMLRRAGIACREEMLIGDPGPAIADFAAAGKCDLVFMGSHGRTGIANLVMGSVASKVIALGSVPVVVVR